jgi:hypothetical protein
MKQIVVINGVGGSGKDTFVECCELFGKVFNVSTVDEVKEVAANVFDWNGGKTEKDRRMLSDLKALWVRYNDGPYRYIKDVINNFESWDGDGILFIHSREPEEISRFANDFGAITLLVKNSRVEPIISNDSDANVELYDYDVVIDNSGTLGELETKAAVFMEEIK